MQVSVVIPFFNEEDSVGRLIAEVHRALEGRVEFEVVGVDDASTDGTLERLKALRREQPSLRIIHHRERCGQSAALWSGVRAARFPWIVTLDGDGQNDPADIPQLLACLEASDRPPELRLVAGRRRRRRDSWLRRVSSRLANGARSFVLGDRCDDTGCGLKVVEREAYLALPFFDHMHRFLPALVQCRGGRVVQVDVNHRPRRAGRSKYGVHNRLWVGLVDLLGVLWLKRRTKIMLAEEVK